jgi:hypothetical protein
MKQSRLMSIVESLGNTATGFVLAIIAQAIFWPLLGVQISATQNLISVGIMTLLSVARSFAWRRLMEAFHVRRPLSAFAKAVIAERVRQVEAEGWSTEHDDAHEPGELARAGAAYAIYAPSHILDAKAKNIFTLALSAWPWSADWWKPRDFRRDLVRSAALVLAEGEKFDRARRTKGRA